MKQVSSLLLILYTTLFFQTLLPTQQVVTVTALPMPPLHASTSTFQKVVKRCGDVMAKHPMVCNGITSCILFSGSDAFAQNLEARNRMKGESSSSSSSSSSCDKNDKNAKSNDKASSTSTILATSSTNPDFEFDYPRFISAGALGIFFGGYVYPAAYARIERMWKGTNFASTLQKSVFEIATVGVFVNSVSMALRGVLSGRQGNDVAKHVWEEMPTVMMNDARVWLPYNLVAFSVIPAHLRPTTTAMMESGWQTYISLRSNDYEGHH